MSIKLNLNSHSVWDLKNAFKDVEENYSKFDNAIKIIDIWNEEGTKVTHRITIGWTSETKKKNKSVQLNIETIESE